MHILNHLHKSLRIW